MANQKLSGNIEKNWGIYTYIAGDNNLSDMGLQDIEEMAQAGASKDVHIAVQIDTEGEHTGSIRYEITEPDFEGNSHRVVIQRLSEQNTGKPRYLAQFASWASKRYPAKNRILVVWNHGAGFMHTPTRDIGYDDSSEGDALTMAELRWALEKAGFGSKAKGKLAILGFDACLMNMLEVAYEFAGISDFVVGSQQTEPGDGWPYDRVVMCAKTGQTSKEVAAGIVDEYIKFYKESGDLGVTQSAVNLNELAALGKEVDKLAGLLQSGGEGIKSQALAGRIVTQGYAEPTYVDLVDLAINISEKSDNEAIKAACSEVITAVQKTVISNRTYGTSVERSQGLSIWFPLIRSDYVLRRSEYVALRYSCEFPGWSRFLDSLLSGSY